MFNRKKILSTIAVCAASVALLTSCATKVTTKVMRPAEFNLRGAKSIAVLPFQLSNSTNFNTSGYLLIDILDFFLTPSSDSEESKVANDITNQLTTRVSSSGYFDLVSSSVVQNAIKAGSTPPVDAYLTGQIIDFDYRTETIDRKKYIDNEHYEIVKDYRRNVELKVMYQVVESSSNKILESRTRKYTASSATYENRALLPSAYTIIENDVNGLVNQIMKELEPYEEEMSFSLLKDKSKNPEMELAKKYVDANLTEKAMDTFMEVYQNTGLFEAGYNAALLHEAFGDYTTAKALMTELLERTGDKRCIKALSQIDYEIAQEAKLQQQQDDRNYR